MPVSRNKSMQPALVRIALAATLAVPFCLAQEQPSPPEMAAESSPRSAPAPVIQIASGDLVEISVYGIPELKQELRVSASGHISLPLVGAIQIAGSSSEQAEKLIAQRLLEGGFLNNPHVSVFVKEYATQGVSILGEVAKPGIYPLLGSRRLFDAVSAAGGLTERAGRLVSITRRDRPQEPQLVNLSRDPAQQSTSNVEILPGDTIVVSKAGVVYVVGEVRRPSGFVMDKNDSMTVLQAVALAEGTTSTASLDSARLIRKTENGHLDIPVPLKKILAGKEPDRPLQAEDILFVPGSLGKSAARRSVDAIVQIVTGIAIFRR